MAVKRAEDKTKKIPTFTISDREKNQDQFLPKIYISPFYDILSLLVELDLHPLGLTAALSKTIPTQKEKLHCTTKIPEYYPKGE